jgi:hypothetical protein
LGQSQSSASVIGGIVADSTVNISGLFTFTASGEVIGGEWNPDPDQSDVWQEENPVINPWTNIEQSSKTWSNT